MTVSSTPFASLPSPRVPVEVLERILELACWHPGSMPLDPAPPPPPTAFLLVSHGFTSLVVPFFYRSVTSYHASDWSAFFDPRKGIFAAGELAERRRAALVELTIRWENPPIDDARVTAFLEDPSFDPRNFKLDLLVPIASNITFPNLSRICLLAEPDRLAHVVETNRARDEVVLGRVRHFIYSHPDPPPKGRWRDRPGIGFYVDWDHHGFSTPRAEIWLALLSASPITEMHTSFHHDPTWNGSDLDMITLYPCPQAKIFLRAGPGDMDDREDGEGYEPEMDPFDWNDFAAECRSRLLPEPYYCLDDLAMEGEQDLVMVGMTEEEEGKMRKVFQNSPTARILMAERGEDGQIGEPRKFVG